LSESWFDEAQFDDTSPHGDTGVYARDEFDVKYFFSLGVTHLCVRGRGGFRDFCGDLVAVFGELVVESFSKNFTDDSITVGDESLVCGFWLLQGEHVHLRDVSYINHTVGCRLGLSSAG
jgi:hypothetical protein